MREIEFRGKRLGSGEWVYGDLIVLTMGAEGKPIDPIACIRIESGLSFEDEVNPVDLKTVGQYTGLNDCNERKIFEGDIVKGCAIPSEGGFDYLGKVVFYNQSNLHGYFIENSDVGGWRIEQAQAKISLDNITGAVIGNVHDAPWLLRKDCESNNVIEVLEAEIDSLDVSFLAHCIYSELYGKVYSGDPGGTLSKDEMEDWTRVALDFIAERLLHAVKEIAEC